MTEDYKAIAKSVSDGAALLRAAAPDSMSGFAAMGKAAYADGALTGKQKELIALSIAITVRCDGCVGAHAKACLAKGATRAEVVEAITVAMHMGGGPSMVYGAEALRAFDQLSGP